MNKKKLLVFTTNKNKFSEIKKIIPTNLFILRNLGNFKKIIILKENGKTFKDNAIKKSKFGFEMFNIPCVAEDSGICIDALNGGPGIKSKRYQKKLGGYNKAINKIINITKTKKLHKATFITVVSLTFKNKTLTFTGKKRGRIVQKPSGKKGFGYDPIFQPLKSFKTYGQMTKKEKNNISHRAIAFKKLIKFLKKNINQW